MPTAQAVNNPCYKFEMQVTETAEMEESQFRTLHVIFPHNKVGNKFRYTMWKAIINRYCLTKLNTL